MNSEFIVLWIILDWLLLTLWLVLNVWHCSILWVFFLTHVSLRTTFLENLDGSGFILLYFIVIWKTWKCCLSQLYCHHVKYVHTTTHVVVLTLLWFYMVNDRYPSIIKLLGPKALPYLYWLRGHNKLALEELLQLSNTTKGKPWKTGIHRVPILRSFETWRASIP